MIGDASDEIINKSIEVASDVSNSNTFWIFVIIVVIFILYFTNSKKSSNTTTSSDTSFNSITTPLDTSLGF